MDPGELAGVTFSIEGGSSAGEEQSRGSNPICHLDSRPLQHLYAGHISAFSLDPHTCSQRSYYARRNGGAFCDGRPLSVSRTNALRDAVIVRPA